MCSRYSSIIFSNVKYINVKLQNMKYEIKRKRFLYIYIHSGCDHAVVEPLPVTEGLASLLVFCCRCSVGFVVAMFWWFVVSNSLHNSSHPIDFLPSRFSFVPISGDKQVI